MVGETAGRGLKRVVLELGGNSPLVVLEDADIEAASSAGAWGSFLHQGQICLAVSRHLVHESIAEEYLAALTERAARLPVGNPASGRGGPRPDHQREADRARAADRRRDGRRRAPRRRRRLARRHVLPADRAPRRDAGDGRVQGGDLRPGGGGHDLQDRRRGGRARERDGVRPLGRGAVRKPGAGRRCRGRASRRAWSTSTTRPINEEPPAPFGGFKCSSNGGHFGGVGDSSSSGRSGSG